MQHGGGDTPDQRRRGHDCGCSRMGAVAAVVVAEAATAAAVFVWESPVPGDAQSAVSDVEWDVEYFTERRNADTDA